MTVVLKDTVPPIVEVAEFGYATVAVDSLLYQSAYQDQRYDKTRCIKRRVVLQLYLAELDVLHQEDSLVLILIPELPDL